MHALVPVLTHGDAGESLWFGGGLLTFKVTSAQSGGAFLMFEHSAARGKPTPLHIHPDHDETCYVLEGELLMHLDGVEHTAGPGATVCIPRGVPHAMLVTSEVERSIWVVTPGEVMEAFFAKAGRLRRAGRCHHLKLTSHGFLRPARAQARCRCLDLLPSLDRRLMCAIWEEVETG